MMSIPRRSQYLYSTGGIVSAGLTREFAITGSNNRFARQLAEVIEIIAAINDARIDERRGFGWHAGIYPAFADSVNAVKS